MGYRTCGWIALGVTALVAATACGGSDSADDTTAPTDAPTTAPAPTEPPTTEPPATDAPTTTAPAPTEPPATEPPAEPLQILVTNDDGVGAAGIDALVQGLLTLEGVVVTVVAPAENQSGSGGNTTGGELVFAETTTASGYPAVAVTGFPADSIIWALDQGGIDVVPDLVVSGINEGQNVGPLVELSGTVGAARAAASRGIPAIAVSAGLGNDTVEENYPAGVQAVLDYLTANVQAIADHEPGAEVPEVISINVPTCLTGGEVRGTVEVPHAAVLPDTDFIGGVDCNSTATDPVDDIDAMLKGYIALSRTPRDAAPVE